MSKAELPVSHIIAIILGVIVLGLLGYFLYTNFIKAGSTVTEETCRSKFTQFCSLWSVTGYKQLPIGYKNGFYETTPECSDLESKLGDDKDNGDSCRKFLSQNKPSK